MRRFLLFLSGCSLLLACREEKTTLQLALLDHVALSGSILKVEVLAENMNVPWDLDADDLGFLWAAEQSGTVSRIDLNTGVRKIVLSIDDVWRERTSGLLGMALHPQFSKNSFVYLNYTTKKDSVIVSRLLRYTFKNDSLINPEILMELDGGTSHNGSRLAFGKDGKLYWATGDVHNNEYAQDSEILNGKILRMNPDGSIPADNPDPTSLVWAKGFRNMQGLVFSDKGFLYTSEHGDAIEDEVNLIRSGGNYGWPIIEGIHDLEAEKAFAEKNQTIEPIRSWTPVIAPSGMTHYSSSIIPEWENSLLLTTLKGKSLRVLRLSADGETIIEEEIFFENHYGRLRDVTAGPNGEIYLSTSNKDWNPQPGFPLEGDDKILKISLTDEGLLPFLEGSKPAETVSLEGKELYLSYCASCHKEDGGGVAEVFPALAGSVLVNGNPDTLIQLVLKGREGAAGKGQMPGFSFLKEEETARILTYIRQTWGNNAGEISSNQINQNR
jgi:glucose/arabinose dehydrogenase/cytochrome c553